MNLCRIAVPSLMGLGALALTLTLASQNAGAAPQGEKVTKDNVTARVEAFLNNLGETTKRGDLIAKMCDGGPIEGLKPNQTKISELVDAEVNRYGIPMVGTDSVALAEEKTISNFFSARTYVVRCERGPSIWHVLLYNGAKGWGVYELGIAPNSHCLIPTWRDFNVVPVRQNTPTPANAGANR